MKDKKKMLFMLCIFLLTFTYACCSIYDYDYWFHYSCGEYVWLNKAVPQTPIWSWYGLENNLEWISHEWLFGLLIYRFVNVFSEKALVILCPALIALASCLAFNFAYNKWKEYPIAFFISFVICASVLSNFATPRPQLLMYIMFIGLLCLLFNEEEKPSNKIWFIVPLTILWTNLHGGSYIIIFISLVFLICSQLFNWNIGNITFNKVDKKITTKRLLVLIISFACVIINGHGYKMYLYPFINITDDVMLNAITEWQCLDLNTLNSLSLSVLFFVASFVILLASGKNKISGYKLLISGMWIFLGFKSVRFIAQMLFVLIMVIPDLFENVLKGIQIKKIELTLLVLSITLLASSSYKVADNFDKPLNKDGFPSEKIIVALKELPENSHLFNPYNSGGYLTYRHINTFVDGRADIYSHYNLQDYVNMSNLSGNVENYINKYGFDYLLLEKNKKLDYWIKTQSSFDTETIIEDENFILYEIVNK